MKRIWFNYNEWEDWANGLYSGKKVLDEEDCRDKILYIFSNQDFFYTSGLAMMLSWPKATLFNLSNTGSNRKSYLGQAVCCFLYGIPMGFTAKRFTELPLVDQIKSNETAQALIKYFEENIYDANHLNIVRGKNEKLS